MGRRRATGAAREHEPQGAAVLAVNLPVPHEALSDGALLMDEERRDLAACELAVDHLRVAFWAAGKALQVIRDGRLYRETHETFEDYVSERWEMSRRQAYRLIEAWPLAERIGVCPIGHTVTESQVRELLPVARKHGEDVAAGVYQAVAEAEGVRVTAALLADAARALPDGGAQLGADQAAEAVRVFLAAQRDGSDDAGGGRVVQPARNADAELAAEIERVQAILRRMESRGLVASDDAEAVRGLVASLRLPKAPADGEAGPDVPADAEREHRYRVRLGCGDTIGRDFPPLDPTTTCLVHGRQDVLGYDDMGLVVQ
jgi:hypothetical protein